MQVTIDTTLKLFNKILSWFLSSWLHCATLVAVLETFPYRILRTFSTGNIISMNSNTFCSISYPFSIKNSSKN